MLNNQGNVIDRVYISLVLSLISPQIKAASEKLSELKDQPTTSSGKSTPTQSPPINMPSANQETLDAQKKRFEELKVRKLMTTPFSILLSSSSSLKRNARPKRTLKFKPWTRPRLLQPGAVATPPRRKTDLTKWQQADQPHS